MTVTGHKAETSLKTYSGQTDDNTKKRMSHTLSSNSLALSEQPANLALEYGSHPVPTRQPLALLPVNAEATPTCEQPLDVNFNIIDDIDSLFGNEENQVVTLQAPPAPAPFTTAASTMMPQMMPFPVLNNCANITIHYNFKQ